MSDGPEISMRDTERILEVILQIDAHVTEDGEDVVELTRDKVDPFALAAIALRRIGQHLASMKAPAELRDDVQLQAYLAPIWCDAFLVGVEFQRRGGHRA